MICSSDLCSFLHLRAEVNFSADWLRMKYAEFFCLIVNERAALVWMLNFVWTLNVLREGKITSSRLSENSVTSTNTGRLPVLFRPTYARAPPTSWQRRWDLLWTEALCWRGPGLALIHSACMSLGQGGGRLRSHGGWSSLLLPKKKKKQRCLIRLRAKGTHMVAHDLACHSPSTPTQSLNNQFLSKGITASGALQSYI